METTRRRQWWAGVLFSSLGVVLLLAGGRSGGMSDADSRSSSTALAAIPGGWQPCSDTSDCSVGYRCADSECVSLADDADDDDASALSSSAPSSDDATTTTTTTSGPPLGALDDGDDDDGGAISTTTSIAASSSSSDDDASASAAASSSGDDTTAAASGSSASDDDDDDYVDDASYAEAAMSNITINVTKMTWAASDPVYVRQWFERFLPAQKAQDGCRPYCSCGTQVERAPARARVIGVSVPHAEPPPPSDAVPQTWATTAGFQTELSRV